MSKLTDEQIKDAFGNEYATEEWICPNCGQEKSTTFKGDNFHSGDGKVVRFSGGIKTEGCAKCLL